MNKQFIFLLFILAASGSGIQARYFINPACVELRAKYGDDIHYVKDALLKFKEEHPMAFYELLQLVKKEKDPIGQMAQLLSNYGFIIKKESWEMEPYEGERKVLIDGIHPVVQDLILNGCV